MSENKGHTRDTDMNIFVMRDTVPMKQKARQSNENELGGPAHSVQCEV